MIEIKGVNEVTTRKSTRFFDIDMNSTHAVFTAEFEVKTKQKNNNGKWSESTEKNEDDVSVEDHLDGSELMSKSWSWKQWKVEKCWNLIHHQSRKQMRWVESETGETIDGRKSSSSFEIEMHWMCECERLKSILRWNFDWINAREEKNRIWGRKTFSTAKRTCEMWNEKREIKISNILCFLLHCISQQRVRTYEKRKVNEQSKFRVKCLLILKFQGSYHVLNDFFINQHRTSSKFSKFLFDFLNSSQNTRQTNSTNVVHEQLTKPFNYVEHL